MDRRQLLSIQILFLASLFPPGIYASFIESTLGAAVVNDATATYYNPAALTLLKNSQFIALGSAANFHNHFTGQFTQTATGFTQSGTTTSHTNYYLPAFYFGTLVNQFGIGLAVISNYFNNEVDDSAILRYVQSNNDVKNVDVVPAIGYRINETLSLGAALNFSYAKFVTEPTIGFPSLNIPDTQSRNDTTGHGLGGDVGLLFKPVSGTLIGFNYRSSISYPLSGQSTFESNPPVVSNNYKFTFWTPARSVLSLSHFFHQR